MGRTRWLFLVFSLPLVLAGCISVGLGLDDPPPAIRYHVLDRTVLPEPAAPGGGRTIAVRSFRASSLHDLRVVERRAAGVIDFAEFERWGEEPFEAATLWFREAFAASGAFQAVLDGSDEPHADYVVGAQIMTFALDTSGEGPYVARFAAHVSLRARDTGTWLEFGTSEASCPLPGRSFDGLGTAMGKAVLQAANAALARWRASGSLE